MGKSKTTEQFVADAIKVHGDRYNYSKVHYQNNRTKVCIVCSNHDEFWQRPSDHLSGRGCPRCPQSSKSSRFSQSQKMYKVWRGVKERCNKVGWDKKYPSYKGCSCSPEWDDFNKFQQWAYLPENGYRDGYHLDKDILVKGNKIYGPETCCFVPKEINNLFTSCKKSRGKLPIGVSKSRGTYLACLSLYSKLRCIGSFKNPEEAFHAYKIAKERYIKLVAEKYFQEGKITKKVYDALMKYEVEITD